MMREIVGYNGSMLDDSYVFRSDRLCIRFYQPSDFSQWQQLFSKMNHKNNQWDWDREDINDLTVDRFNNKLARHAQERKDGIVYYLCVENNETQLIGISLINNIDRALLSAEIGFQLNNRYWGYGYGKELLHSIVEIARTSLHLNIVYAYVNGKNYGSIHILNRAGFTKSERNNNNELQYYKKRILL